MVLAWPCPRQLDVGRRRVPCRGPIGLLPDDGAQRTLYVGIAHHARTGRFSARSGLTPSSATSISMLLVTLAHDRYQVEHARATILRGNSARTTTPILQFLLNCCGFDLAHTRLELGSACRDPHLPPLVRHLFSWREFRGSITSPARAAASRSPGAVSWAYLGHQAAAGLVRRLVHPLVVGFAASAVLQFLRSIVAGSKPVTIARFLGDPPPSHAIGLGQWLWRAALMHLPQRIAVL